MSKKLTTPMIYTRSFKSKGNLKKLRLFSLLGLMFMAFMAGCKKDDFTGEIFGECPVVVSTLPSDKAVDVNLDQVISATFNVDMNASTINSSTFIIKNGDVQIAGLVEPTDDAKTFTFTPNLPLDPFVIYTGTITTGAKDTLRTAMEKDYVWTFTTIPQVTLSAAPSIGGTIDGEGNFAQGSTVGVVADPNPGFVFANFTENGIIVSTNSSYTFIMNGNKALVANFTPIQVGNFGVTVNSSPAAGGKTTGNGSYPAGSSVTVTATPNAGYTFTNFTENGLVVSTNSSYQFIIAGNRTLVANFTFSGTGGFTVNVTSNPLAGGITTGQGTYPGGTAVRVTATAKAGYIFTNFTENGNIVSNSSPYNFALTSNRNLVANFRVAPASFTVNVTSNPLAGGTTIGQGTYPSGSSVTITATPKAGYTFKNFTENGTIVSTNSSYNFIINRNRTLVANFTPTTGFAVNITSNPLAGGTTTGQGSYASGSPVTVTATANMGYTFTNFTENGAVVSSNSPYNFNISSNRTLVANFSTNVALGPQAINLGSAKDFVTLTKSGISTTGVTSIIGNIGVSPASSTAITGFGLIMDANGQSSTTPIVTGKVYASDYAAPTPAKMTTAVSDMETAFTTGNNLVTPAPIVGLYAGDISGRILPPGLYKWSTGVLVTNAGVTLSGGPNDVWVFQIAQNLTVNNNAQIKLVGGAQAKNVFWVVTGQATLGTNANFSGIILSKTLISLNTGAKVTGRLYAQTAVTLNASTVTQTP